MLTAIVPAAGKGERFGGRKLLALVDGVPMLERTIRSLLDGGVDQVIVVLAPDSEIRDMATPLVAALANVRVRIVINRDPSRGMFSSIQAGLAAVPPERDCVLVLPGDMPFVQPETIAALVADRRCTEIVSPAHDGRRGHPIVLPGAIRSALLAADARGALNDVLDRLRLARRQLDVNDPGILRDVDTTSDLPRQETSSG